MEVHKHPHHVTHKKKFGEYLLEFFMLFLAVFLGFIAENVREHLVDSEKVRQYMHTMVENLKYDTTRCGINARKNIASAAVLDSLRYELGMAIDGHASANKLYYDYLRYFFGGGGHAIFNKAALEQMQSSGSLRLIKNDKLVTELLDYYDRHTTASEHSYNTFYASRTNFFQTSKKVFNARYFDPLYTKETTFGSQADTASEHFLSNLSTRQQELKLLSSKPDDLQSLYNDAADVETDIRTYNSFLRWTRSAADTLIRHINSNYHFNEAGEE